jgi:hypothetical protein
MKTRSAWTIVVVAVALGPWNRLQAQSTTPTTASVRAAAADSAAADSADRAFLAADDRRYEQQLIAKRTQYLKGASWADLGDRCNPGALRVFAQDTTPAQRDSLQSLAESMEQTIVARGAGARLDTPEARQLLRIIVGWEAGIDRPLWDVDDGSKRLALATGLTGDVPDPKGAGCLPSPVVGDTVTFVIPGFASMDFPKAARPRVKAYFGAQGQQHARDEFFAARGSKEPTAELSYIVVAPMVLWRGWAVVGVDRPRERGGVEVGQASNGGAAYLLRRVGSEWRLVTIVRTWGS